VSSAPAGPQPEVVDVAEWNRFEIGIDGRRAGLAAYRLSAGEITFTHTEIDDAFAGQGLGGVLVRGALDTARARGLAVLPSCPFVRAWIAKHPDYLDLVPTARRSDFGLRV
jgi:uncharacterized protein